MLLKSSGWRDQRLGCYLHVTLAAACPCWRLTQRRRRAPKLSRPASILHPYALRGRWGGGGRGGGGGGRKGVWATACCIKSVLQVELAPCAEQSCCCPAGPVSKIRLLGDYHHATRIAFIEFDKADSAKIALNCSGALLGAPGCPQHCPFLAGGSSACLPVVFGTATAVLGGGSCESLPACPKLGGDIALAHLGLRPPGRTCEFPPALYALAPLGS